MKDGRFSDLWRCNTHSQLYRTENYWKAPSDGSERKESPPPPRHMPSRRLRRHIETQNRQAAVREGSVVICK
jgi:hypothetical protein